MSRYSNDMQITKTIIKGLKEVKRLAGIQFQDGVPRLRYETFTASSDAVIQEVDFELFIGDHLITLVDGVLEQAQVIDSSAKDGVRTVVVRKCIEKEEQKFNYEAIMAEYRKQFDEFYSEFIKQYEDDKFQMSEINRWIGEGITREEIVDKLIKEKSTDRKYPEPSCEISLKGWRAITTPKMEDLRGSLSGTSSLLSNAWE